MAVAGPNIRSSAVNSRLSGVIDPDVGSDADVECVESAELRPGGPCRLMGEVSDGQSTVGGFRR